MQLAYREDWPAAADRLSRWWEGEYLGRPVMDITAPRDGAQWRELPQPPTLRDFWANPDYVVPRTEQAMRCTAFLGEACPQAWVNLGPVSAAGFLGTRVVLRPDTIWQEPIIDDWDSYRPQFDREGDWWQTTVKLTRALAEVAEGNWLVGTADLVDVGDVLAYLRGPREFCLDLLEGPREQMLRIRDQLLSLTVLFYNELTGLLLGRQQGGASWLGVWSPKRTATLQCDFSCMVSRAMFDDFLLPTIAAQTLELDHVAYHLDGPGALHHVESLLSLPRLHMIQWVPGSGAEDAAHPRWRPLLRRIIDAGVRVHLQVAPGQVRDLIEDLPPQGLYLRVGCASEEEAGELLAAAGKWAARG